MIYTKPILFSLNNTTASTARQTGLFETVERIVEDEYGNANALSGFVDFSLNRC